MSLRKDGLMIMALTLSLIMAHGGRLAYGNELHSLGVAIGVHKQNWRVRRTRVPFPVSSYLWVWQQMRFTLSSFIPWMASKTDRRASESFICIRQ
jgi:hypothetical protein